MKQGSTYAIAPTDKWEIKKLGDIASIMYGYTAKAKSEPAKAKYLRITDIQNNSVDWAAVPFCDLNDDEYSKYYLKYGDIVFTRTGATTGKSFLVLNPPNAVFASYLIRVQTNPKQITPEFLYQYFQTPFYWNVINIGISGSAQGGFNATKLGELKIPIPPIVEQKRIVAKLDQCFAALDKARAHVEKNLQNAKELFQSQLNQIFSQRGDGWVEKKWSELCHFVRGPFGGSLKKSMFKESGYVVYEQKHAIHDHFNHIRYFIDEEKFNEMKRFEVKAGDIIMSCSGVTLGRVAIIPDNIQRGIINQALLKLTPNKIINVNFLKHWLRSKNFQDIIFKYSGGAAIPNVPSVKILKEIIIPIPNIDEQKEIVNKIEELKAQTKTLEYKYRQELDALDELKKSILQKAFRGEL